MTATPLPPHRLERSHVAPPPSRTDAAGPSHDESEAYSVLLSLAERRTLRIPAGYLVRHVLSLHRDADWPVQREALQAALRRAASAKQEQLRVAQRPPNGAALGLYRTSRGRQSARPYRTLIRGLSPLDASCDCPDFVKSSLGLCKHVLCVLDELSARSGRFEQARRSAARAPTPPTLRWDPVRPLHGAGDWLERVELRANAGRHGSEPESLAQLRQRFVRVNGGPMRPKPRVLAKPRERLELVRELRAIRARAAGAASLDPALDALTRAEERRLEARLGLGIASGRATRGLRRELYPYQRAGLERFLASGRLLLADDMGLGKTIQAIAAAHALFRAGRARRGLILAPASLKAQWQREWLQTTDVPVAIVEGAPPERRRAYQSTAAGFLIANYEQLWRDLDLVVRWNPELVVLDEAQRIKNWATKTAAHVKRLAPPYRLVLTGTPMENRLAELASIMEWVDEHALEPKWRLVPWHSLLVDGRFEVAGVRNLDTLRERLAPSMLRRLRSEVLSELPPRTDTVVPVELCEIQREEHDALYPPIARLASIARRRPLTQQEFLRLMTLLTTQRIIANGIAQLQFPDVWPALAGVADPDEALLKSLGSPKLLELRTIVASLVLEQGRKVVVFSQWRRMLRLAAWCVEPLLRPAGLRAVFFTGEESLKRRTQNLVDLHDDRGTRILFATDAGGVGVNLQRAASACVNLDLPWNPAVLEQRVGRIHRIGQREPIDVFNLVSVGSIEERIASLVSEKKAVFSGLFDGSSDEVRFDRSGRFIAQVERLLEGAGVAAGAAEREADEESEDADLAEVELSASPVALDDAAPEGRAPDAARPAAGAEALRAEPEPSPQGAPAPPPKDAAPLTRELSELLGSLEIRQTPSGRIHIEAPAEAAAGIAAVLRNLAGLLERA
jgi:superfamily II DNA or RNA helicase